MKKVKFILFLFLILIFVFSCSQTNSKIKFQKISHSFDTIIPALDESSHFFVYENNGNSNLVIDSINTSCGCTIAKFSREPLPQKEKDSFLVEYNNIDNKGHFVKEVMVYSNAENSPTRIYIKGFAL